MRCRQCNYKLPQGAVPGAAPASSFLICWNCAAQNPAHHSRCACCNARLEDIVGKDCTPHSVTRKAYHYGQPEEF